MKININPVLRKEAKTTVRTWRIGVLIAIYVGVLSSVAVITFGTFLKNMAYGGARYEELPTLYMAIESLQLVLILFIVPSLSASAISGERERQTLDILLSTKMSPLSIVIGKLMASLSKVVLLIISTIPVFSLVFLFGGVSVMHIFQVTIFYLVTALYVGGISIFISTFFKSSRVSNVVVYAVGLFLTLGTLFITFIYFQYINLKYVSTGQSTLQNFSAPFYLYLNPLWGYGSLVSNQLGGGGAIPGIRTVGQYANTWIINCIVEVIMSVILILLSAWKLNPIKRYNKKRISKI
ncbi:ABC transporter permease [Clostridium algidicarnis]|uniref:ABC transporter permease n=1 Tax=Clostridium algidicarnis TaxID=37659 RepID=UPI001C0C87DB|nr:ABC transporter permease subunit [Clostridium algidicarnis]MBU3195109.1 ABC transporter permease [Clostridium algidicarnis]MBU3208065.1 ABC transporter permease [Clostridium algidicarnis]MBU3227704.1 ABC transporter permease [Clostridium algidicarnis]MBU3250889.1 ABC transporter permease [Clostridium algidicarnis]